MIYWYHVCFFTWSLIRLSWMFSRVIIYVPGCSCGSEVSSTRLQDKHVIVMLVIAACILNHANRRIWQAEIMARSGYCAGIFSLSHPTVKPKCLRILPAWSHICLFYLQNIRKRLNFPRILCTKSLFQYSKNDLQQFADVLGNGSWFITWNWWYFVKVSKLSADLFHLHMLTPYLVNLSRKKWESLFSSKLLHITRSLYNVQDGKSKGSLRVKLQMFYWTSRYPSMVSCTWHKRFAPCWCSQVNRDAKVPTECEHLWQTVLKKIMTFYRTVTCFKSL